MDGAEAALTPSLPGELLSPSPRLPGERLQLEVGLGPEGREAGVQPACLGYNEGLNTDRFAFDPVRPFTGTRTLLIKYSHMLDLGF